LKDRGIDYLDVLSDQERSQGSDWSDELDALSFLGLEGRTVQPSLHGGMNLSVNGFGTNAANWCR
jgi:hypothetical protein